ncbi:tyrosine-type recombinase/integrase [Devosia ginsengisoli]|uniref:Tyrosine-type recombinase/integrase n=1 Tax=Devosia ginsengisoli TaxID=400770 RepID=A0A5B8LS34_9HYPH|nr:tyrosine-type recombinase/integrase [Devosia ginsengisoli]QDZ10699.1 tyrosine-type recombinase/integrase [Devosia ginsengisoli]
MKPKKSWKHSFHKQMATKAVGFFQHALRLKGRWQNADKDDPWNRGLDDNPKLRRESFDIVRTVADLIQLYTASGSFRGLSAASKKSYQLYLDSILTKFGASPLKMFDERGARTLIRQWRDNELASRPRTADATIAILRLILNFAVDEEYLYRNPAAGLGCIHTITRRDIIWTDGQIAAFLSKAPRHLSRVLLLAIWTGQRQADLINLKWEAYDGRYIMLQPRKSYRGKPARRVKVLVAEELRKILKEINLEQIARANDPNPKKRRPQPDYILTNSRGIPWVLEGFKGAWRKAVAHAGLSGVTFHDLRGTFITLSHRAGASIMEIAEATGHDEKECERIIRKHYLAAGGEPVVMKLEAAKRFAPKNWLRANAEKFDAKERHTAPRHPRMSTRFEQISAARQARLDG